MALKLYDPKSVLILFNGFPVVGIADGQFISVQRNTQAFRVIKSVNGAITRAKTLDTSGTIEITLQQSSTFNDVFTAFLSADTLTGKGLVATVMAIKDLNGSSLVVAPKVWINRYPEMNYSNNIGFVTWEFISDNLVISVGGSTSI